MKYKLINNTTKEEHLCDKVTIDGFDYYVSDEKPKENDWCIKEQQHYGKSVTKAISYSDLNSTTAIWKKVIATNNPNIDIPKVVNDVEIICIKDLQDFYGTNIQLTFDGEKYLSGFKTGYNKSQETHPNSDEDMIRFAEWVDNMGYTQVGNGLYKSLSDEKGKSTKELLQLWKEQQPKIVYYNE